ncbi:adenosylcobinamide-phosphate synthase CbiB [Mesorhizobium sp. 1B3]|uniref:adenosylcobinamide-phosphate synthase CbiB n=1 Tax=Mesorhizobium sp. 1B3 TaxID=3243599 RepID=UPI003D97BD66
MSILLAFLALSIERVFGYPSRLLAVIGHPVMWIGAFIAALDKRFNRTNDPDATRRAAGVAALVGIVAATGVAALAVQNIALALPFGTLLAAVVASSLIAQRSLGEHVAAVAQALETEGLEGGRRAVSRIVGRDPEKLDEAGVSRAAIESLSENFSDGIVAPAFWLAVAGLPGAAIYKAVNTADSMIGHRSPRHEAFGWASARFDDLINLPASRFSALLIVLAAFFVSGASPKAAWQSVRQDAHRHRSPNAGWPEATMAGALGLALAGPRHYGGVLVDDATMGAGGRREATAADIRRALLLYWWADGLLIGIMGAAAVVWVSV